MGFFARLFGGLLLFVYHGFDRLVIHGYPSGWSRPDQVVYSIPVGAAQFPGIKTMTRA